MSAWSVLRMGWGWLHQRQHDVHGDLLREDSTALVNASGLVRNSPPWQHHPEPGSEIVNRGFDGPATEVVEVPFAAGTDCTRQIAGQLGVVKAGEHRARSFDLVGIGMQEQSPGFGLQTESVRLAAVLLCAHVEQQGQTMRRIVLVVSFA